MKRVALLFLAIQACGTRRPTERYGFIALLGVDTVSVESVTRNGNTLVSDEVDRFPSVRQRHSEIVLGPDGSLKHLVMDITTPSEPADERVRHVVADNTGDSVYVTKQDSTGTKAKTFYIARGLTMAHIPQMYSLIDLYFAGALKRADSLRLAQGDRVRVLQFYVDREFDNFGLHEGFVRPLPGHKAELRHNWLSGVGEATYDSAYHMLTYSGARSTYKVDVRRIPTQPNVAAIGARFAALEANSGVKQLSVRDTARGSIGGASFLIDYGRPLARGRVLLGSLIPIGNVWRTGANAATQFTTSTAITLAGMRLPKGTYTLWTLPRENGAELIVNKQVGQWGTEYDQSSDLGRASLDTRTAQAPVEKFTISIAPSDARHGTLVLEWGTFRWTAPIVVL
ncbi:MAG TPA: DUF2911 domain-containing protein [Gemmatimonadaceae bacterium]|nr:DUF2911 domain-containing protein [Gemmatimonadaceae bacterium]